ncbi:hypothetical protein OUZ56_010156 [Daphnia magna]|uniref:Uncharacterized protein n=1 Tax=Daphnia magna TaxID=35525 RepID=A0ABR0AHZ2_9CRUS|nr:hypothetical protein OUZ56_010156 [Daphnia magna]
MIENQFDLKTDAHSSITLNSKGGVPDMVYKFVPLESIASINDGQVIDTFGYVCDIGGMTTSVVHESFGDNMLVNMTIGCTNETRLLISGMGFRRGHWFGRSGIQEDSIVAIKGVKIERRVEWTQDWIGHLFDDSSFVVVVVEWCLFLLSTETKVVHRIALMSSFWKENGCSKMSCVSS